MKRFALISLLLSLTACNSDKAESPKEIKTETKETVIEKPVIEKPEEKIVKEKEVVEEKKEKVASDLQPKIVFSNQGIILPKAANNKISFRGVNVKKIHVKVDKVFPNNITQFLQKFYFKGDGNVLDYSMQRDLNLVGETVLDKDFEISHEKNIWVQNEIDLSKLMTEKGVYTVHLSFDKDGIDYTFPEGTPEWKKSYVFGNSSQVAKAVLVTDMAMLAQKEVDGKLVATVIDVVTSKPIPNVEIQAISLNNQLIEKKVSDENGEVSFDKGDKVFYLLATNNKDFSILKLEDSKLSYDGFLVDGEYSSSKTKAFIYSSRGIYRPGDEINIGVIARNDDKTFAKDQPIKIDVFSPRGDKYIDSRVLKDGKNGFFSFSFKTQEEDATGLWTVVAHIDGNKDKKFSLKIPVETIISPKIEVEANFPKEVRLSQGEIKGSLSSKYLFGSPASNLSYTSRVRLLEKEIKFEKFKNFNFSNPTTYMPNFNFSTKGVLDKDGKGDIIFKNLARDIPSNMTFTGEIVTKVNEPNGRAVTNIENIEINRLDSYVGLEVPENNFVKSGTSLNLEVISVDSEGNFTPNRKIKYRVYRNEYSWWWDYYSYNEYIKSIKTDKNTTLLYEGEFVSGDKPHIIDYEVSGSGEVFVEVEDTGTKQTAGTTLYVSTWQDSKSNKMIDKLKIDTNKKSYKVGEKAIISFEGAKGNRALVTLSKGGKILSRYWKDVDSLDNKVEVEVDSNLFPNGYVSVALFQNYGESSNDRPLRLYGAVPIIVDSSEKKLELKIEAPKQLKPFEKFKVKVINPKEGKVDYTLSVVDEGLLGITNFKTPNPYSYFYQKQGLQLSSYDNYSEVIGKTFGKVHQVLTPGGDVALMAANSAPRLLNQTGVKKAQRFNPLSIFKGVLTTSSDGVGEVEIELPNYTGAVRLMVTAANEDKFGYAEERIEVKAPIITDLSMPRSLKIGDKVSVPVTIFALEEDLGKIDVKFEFAGKVENKKIEIENGKSKTIYFDIEVGNKVGVQKAILTASSKNYKASEDIEIDVTSDNPYTYINKVESIKSGKLALDIPSESVGNSASGEIKISTKPLLSIENRINELSRYPYGCLEQIVSQTMPQLYLEKLTDGNTKLDKKKIVRNINATIKKLAKYQTYNGGFAYWPGGRKSDLERSIYAMEFLINANEQGYYIAGDISSSWNEYLVDMIETKSTPLALKAYGMYVLSLANISAFSEVNYLYDNDFEKLDNLAKWYLAATYYNLDEKNLAKKIAKELPLEFNNLKDQAIVLNLYYTIFDKIPQDIYSNVVKSLQSKSWLSTDAMGYSMLALGHIKDDSKASILKAKVTINGVTKDIKASDGIYRIPLDKDVTSVQVEGENLFVNEYWQGIPINYEREDEANNMVISRKFYDENGNEIDVTKLDIGRSFYMGIKVEPKESKDYFSVENVALTQIIPSGWEIENLRALNLRYPNWVQNKMDGNNLDYEDIRDDRVNFFFTFDNYEQEYFIKLNAVTKGNYTLPGTEAQAMYDPAYSGYIKGFKVEVK